MRAIISEKDAPAANGAPPGRAQKPERFSQNAQGVALMALGMFLFSGVDAQVKLLSETLHPIQVAWSRQAGLFVAVAAILAVRGFGILRTQQLGLQITRGLLAASAAVIFIIGVSFVPLADAIAISFVAPFIVTILGAYLLGEPVGAHRWTAVAVGFLGALIIIRPGAGVVHPAALFVLVAASLFALRQVLSRALSHADRTITTIAYTALTASIALSLPLPFVWRWPETDLEIGLLVGVAIMAGVGEACVIRALDLAQAVAVAPMQYTLLLWSTIYGYLIFGELPDAWTWVGALIIVASGVYVIHRERLASRRRRMVEEA